jgi:hypothetical protein
MKKIITVFFLVLVTQSAEADFLIKFKDQKAHVWQSYYAKGSEYCTQKSYGEYCVEKSDVVSVNAARH